MTIAFAALLIGVAVAALLLALGTYLYVNRTPSPNERFDEYGRVPLFGVDLVATPNAGNPVITEVPPVLREIQVADPAPSANVRAPKVDSVIERIEKTDTPLDPHANYRPRIVRTPSEPTTPRGEPILIDTSAVDSLPADTEAQTGLDDDAAESLNPGADSVPPKSTPARHLQSDHKLGGAGWGKTPGWPVPEAATPRFVPPVPDSRSAPPPVAPAAASNGNGVFADGVPGSMVEGHRLRYSTPAEGTLQFLPGRLEITSGLDTGREIRFVRLPGPSGTEVTFGRNEGPLYRHIQLRDQTVSREHARMTLIDGHWLLTNLSKTNPVAHNGRVLGPGEHQLLTDGDRLDMGEVIFSFRSR